MLGQHLLLRTLLLFLPSFPSPSSSVLPLPFPTPSEVSLPQYISYITVFAVLFLLLIRNTLFHCHTCTYSQSFHKPVLTLSVICADIVQLSFSNDGHGLIGCYMQFKNTAVYFGKSYLLLKFSGSGCKKNYGKARSHSNDPNFSLVSEGHQKLVCWSPEAGEG